MITVEPEVKQNLQTQQQTAPEWARVISQVLPMLFPTGATGAALSQVPGQAQPQTGWGHILTLLPLLLGGIGMMRGGGGEKAPSSLDELRAMTEARGGKGLGAPTPRPRDLFAPNTPTPTQPPEELRGLFGRWIDQDLARYKGTSGGINTTLQRLKALLPTLSPEHLEAIHPQAQNSEWEEALRMVAPPQAGARP